MSAEKLPQFASQWIQQWKQAAPRLQAIRDEELRRRDGRRGPAASKSGTIVIFDRYPERNGMVVMQRWFMRRQLLNQSRCSQESQ